MIATDAADHPELPSSDGRRVLRGAPFALGLIAVVLYFTISSNLLFLLGINYNTPGGNPAMKLHPATYLLGLAAALVVLSNGKPGEAIDALLRERPALLAFLVLIPACAFYSIASVGISGAAVYIESYFAAGLLALVLEQGSKHQRRVLGYIVLALCVVSVALAGYEAVIETHIVPIFLEGEIAEDLPGEFRGSGLYDHPLTGAMVTSMGTLLLLIMRPSLWVAGPTFMVLLLGLLSFGGRAALAVTIVLVVTITLSQLIRGLASRRLSAGFVGVVVGGVITLPPVAVALVAATGLGDRILNRLYFDDSAEVRNIQWRVLDHLSVREFLFGVRPDDLVEHMFQIGLSGPFTDIENFWLLGFVNLGAIGFAVFVVAFLLFLFHLGHRLPPLGWVLIASTILIASTSNSLGRKGSTLCMLVACAVAGSAYRHRHSSSERSMARPIAAATSSRGLQLGPIAASPRRIDGTRLPPLTPISPRRT